MSFVSSHPCSHQWSSSTKRSWCGRNEPIDGWNDWNAQLSMLSDIYANKDNKEALSQLVSKSDPNKFEIKLDVSHYSPEEFTVKIVDKDLVIECKHEEKKDEFGWVSRQFTRKFSLPEDVDIEKIHSTLSSSGVLSVEVPKKVFQTKEENVVLIPVIHEKDLNKDQNQTKEEKSEEVKQQ